MTIKKEYLIEKGNLLNEMRTSMTLEEIRFFTLYLARINPRDISTSTVKISLDDFRELYRIKRTDKQHLNKTTDELLKKVVNIPAGALNREYREEPEKKKDIVEALNKFQGITKLKETDTIKITLFITAYISDEDGKQYITIAPHPAAIPLLFDLKGHYFNYQLWNTLFLKSPNQVRMYEILKQYQNLGSREMAVEELRELLGIKPGEYKVWQNFKVKVLDSCQKALEESTDIRFTYKRAKAGPGGKWLRIRFDIFKNENYEVQQPISGYFSETDVVSEEPDSKRKQKKEETIEQFQKKMWWSQTEYYIDSVAYGEFFDYEIEEINKLLSRYDSNEQVKIHMFQSAYEAYKEEKEKIEQYDLQEIKDPGKYLMGIIKKQCGKPPR